MDFLVFISFYEFDALYNQQFLKDKTETVSNVAMASRNNVVKCLVLTSAIKEKQALKYKLDLYY